jgi:hypothetical protein
MTSESMLVLEKPMDLEPREHSLEMVYGAVMMEETIGLKLDFQNRIISEEL